MKRIAVEIETDELCHYGCGCLAKYKNGSGNLMCLPRSNSCPAIREKNKTSVKNSYAGGKRESQKKLYASLSKEKKDAMAWNRGKSATEDNRILSGSKHPFHKKRFGASLRGHSEETKKRMSEIRSKWLSVPGNRKNYGRHKPSWLESSFEEYLKDNLIEDYETEFHIRNTEINKNYFIDFMFKDRKLVIELDGTQHRNSVEADKIRDDFITRLGYKVVRIPQDEFKKRYFDKSKGFKDILGG